MPSLFANKVFQTTLAAILLLVVLIGVHYFIGWAALLSPWQMLSTSELVVALVLVFCSYGIRALRLYDYYRRQIKGYYPTALRLMLMHNFYNNILPMRSGEVSFPLLMHQYFAVPASHSVPVLLWFRLLDAHSLLLMGILLWLLAKPSFISLLLMLLILSLPYVIYQFQSQLNKHFSRQGDSRLAGFMIKALQALPQNNVDFWRSWMWTLLNWVVKMLVFAWILHFFSGLSFTWAFAGAIGGDASSVLPIHGFAGVGTYEAGVLAALAMFDVDFKGGLAAAVNLHLFVLGCSLLSFLLAYLIPLKVKLRD